MAINITPELFIETLAELLETERYRRAVRLVSQHRAKAKAFRAWHSPRLPDDIVPVDRFQYRLQGADSLRDRALPFSHGKPNLTE